MRRLFLSTALAFAFIITADTSLVAHAGPSAVYVMKDGNLLGNARLDGKSVSGNLATIAEGGWTGKIAAAKGPDGKGYLYLMKEGNLYGAELDGPDYRSYMHLITLGGWESNAEFAVSDGFVYLMKDDNLYAAPLLGLTYPATLTEIAHGGWHGQLAVANNYVYLMKDDTLYAARLNGLSQPTSLKELTHGGWSGDLAVVGKAVYVLRYNADGKAELVAGDIDGDSYTLSSQIRLASGEQWFGVFAVGPDLNPPAAQAPVTADYSYAKISDKDKRIQEILKNSQLQAPDPAINTMLWIKDMICHNADDLDIGPIGGVDEVYFVVSGMRSDERPYVKILGKDSFILFDDDDGNSRKTRHDLLMWEGYLSLGQSVKLQVTVCEHDDDYATFWSAVLKLGAAVVANMVGSPVLGIAGNSLTEAAGNSGLLSAQDTIIGSFACHISRDPDGRYQVSWEPQMGNQDKEWNPQVSSYSGYEFRLWKGGKGILGFNGDGDYQVFAYVR